MKNHILFLLLFMFVPFHLFAQDVIEVTDDIESVDEVEEIEEENEFQEYNFVYIAHESNDAVDIISSRLQDMKDNADQYGNSYIFYLANGSAPIVVRYNLPNGNPDDFNKLLGELNNSISHSVDHSDLSQILELIKKDDFLDENGNLKYYITTFDFYVGADFWTLGYNESIIASLYYLLDVPTMKVQEKEFNFRMNAFKENYPKYDEGRPFGVKNLIGINKEMILQYMN